MSPIAVEEDLPVEDLTIESEDDEVVADAGAKKKKKKKKRESTFLAR